MEVCSSLCLMLAGWVKMIEGRGKLVDAHTICVNGKNYTVSI